MRVHWDFYVVHIVCLNPSFDHWMMLLHILGVSLKPNLSHRPIQPMRLKFGWVGMALVTFHPNLFYCLFEKFIWLHGLGFKVFLIPSLSSENSSSGQIEILLDGRSLGWWECLQWIPVCSVIHLDGFPARKPIMFVGGDCISHCVKWYCRWMESASGRWIYCLFPS